MEGVDWGLPDLVRVARCVTHMACGLACRLPLRPWTSPPLTADALPANVQNLLVSLRKAGYDLGPNVPEVRPAGLSCTSRAECSLLPL